MHAFDDIPVRGGRGPRQSHHGGVRVRAWAPVRPTPGRPIRCAPGLHCLGPRASAGCRGFVAPVCAPEASPKRRLSRRGALSPHRHVVLAMSRQGTCRSRIIRAASTPDTWCRHKRDPHSSTLPFPPSRQRHHAPGCLMPCSSPVVSPLTSFPRVTTAATKQNGSLLCVPLARGERDACLTAHDRGARPPLPRHKDSVRVAQTSWS